MKLIPKFLDPTDITTLVNKGTGKHVIADGFSTIPIYKGKQYSIKDVVNNDGTVNIRKAKKIMEEVAEYFGGKKMQNRLENPIWHKDDPNTWLHTKKVAQNAWAIPVPEGYTKQDQMIAALGHDFGKILSGDGHAEVSYNLIKQVFPDATPKQLEAVRRHMNDLGTHTDLLEQATKFADIGVVPGADFTQIGLTPEELEIIKQTKWFKEGGNIQYFDKGGTVYKLLNELYHKVNKGIPLTDWSPEQWDQVYNYVLKRYGEKESNILQKIRDYHFWAKAPNTKLSEVSGKPIEVVHHTNSDPFTVFDKKRRGQTDSGHRGLGYYFDSKQTYNPEIYGKNTISAYLNIQNPIQGNSRKNLSTLDDVDQYIINLGKGTRNELIAERVAKGLGKDSEEISDLIIISKYYLKQRRVNKSYKNYIPEDLKTLGLKADSSDLEIEQAVENKVKELLQKEAERYYPKNFDSIDGYMDEYENVVYSPTQIKSSASITQDDQGNIIPLSQRDNFNNEDIRFKDGGTLKLQEGGVLQENTQPLFRHLPNEYIAQDFDNDLNELFYSRQIKYGQLSEKAERKLQKKYNLDYTQLKETLDDLFNAGLGQALVADLLKANTNLASFKEGGTIQKCSIGSAIKKFAGKGLESIESKVAQEVGENIALQATGTTKVIGKATTEHLKKVAKVTNDQRIKVLADFAEQCRNKGIKLPEEFNQFIDSIFKTPVATKTDKKIVRVGKEVTADPEIITHNGISVERPTFDKIKYKTKTEHTGEFKDKLEFKRTVPKTQEELQELSPKIDEAINSLRSMMEGDSFKLTPTMMDEIYAKSKGRVQNFKDNKEQTGALRKLFGEIEYPTLVKRQLDKSYVYPHAPSQELVRFYNANAENIEWFKVIRNLTQHYMKGPDYYGPVGKIQVTPLKITPKEQQVAVYHRFGDYTSFLPKQIMTKQDAPYIKAYRLTVDGKPIKGTPTFNFEEHHSTPLALMQAEAYLTNPSPKNAMEHVLTYQNQRKVNGSKDAHYNKFLVLDKAEHTGVNGIHYNDKWSLQDLQRIKALSRSGRFKTMDDLLYYYDRLKAQQLSYLPKAKQGTKLIPKNAFGSALMRELVPKASKITGKTERQLIKELAQGTLSEKKLMELTKDVVESVNGKILKPEQIKPGMLDFEHYWYFGHGTDVEHLPSIIQTGLKGSLSDTAINQFLIGNQEVFDAALEMAKQGKGLHHNAKGFNVIQVPKLPGQTKPPKDLLDYLTPEEVTSHIVEDRTPARFNYFAVDTTI